MQAERKSKMSEMSYAPIYEEWVDLMEAKDTPEKQVAFMEGIFRYAFSGTRARNPKEMERPCGLDYARFDGYVICRKMMDRMRKSIKVGADGGRQRRTPKGGGGPKAIPQVEDADGADGDADGAGTAQVASALPPPSSPSTSQVPPHCVDGYDAERSCRPPSLPTEAEMTMFASNVGVPREYLAKFLARQREIGWEYVNRAGVVVRLSRRNFKSVLRAFWDSERKAQEAAKRKASGNGGGGAQPEGVVLKGEMRNDYGF